MKNNPVTVRVHSQFHGTDEVKYRDSVTLTSKEDPI